MSEHRNFGPWMSPRMRTLLRPSSLAVLRMHGMSSSNWPGRLCDELSRKTSTPAAMSFLIISALIDAGPNVATIWPLRSRKSTSFASSSAWSEARSLLVCFKANAVGGAAWRSAPPWAAAAAGALGDAYSANDSALWIACCLPLGSFGSIWVGAGSRVASAAEALAAIHGDGGRGGGHAAEAERRRINRVGERERGGESDHGGLAGVDLLLRSTSGGLSNAARAQLVAPKVHMSAP